MENTFNDAADNGKVEEVKSILRKNPSLNVNWKSKERGATTALYIACISGHDSVVSILLAHPDIDPNLKNTSGNTPFLIACANGNTSCVRLLLQDQRVMVNEPDNNGATPLWRAAYWGRHDVIKWWIGSGREMNLGKPGDISKTDAIGAAKERRKTEVVSLLERFKKDASKTRSQVRLELGITTGQSIHLLISLHSLFFSFLGFDDLNFFFFLFFSFYFSLFLDFPVTTPPRLTREQYTSLLDMSDDLIATFLGGKPVLTTGGLYFVLSSKSN